MRQPLAASSQDCRQAEELQTSLGEGPCLDAAEARSAIVAELEARWPLSTEELTGRTAFRAVAAVPLRDAPTRTASTAAWTTWRPTSSRAGSPSAT